MTKTRTMTATMRTTMEEIITETMRVRVTPMKAAMKKTMKSKALKKMKEAVYITTSPPSPSSLVGAPSSSSAHLQTKKDAPASSNANNFSQAPR